MAYDQECQELAEHFLVGIKGVSQKHIAELAQAIQDVCEDYASEAEAWSAEPATLEAYRRGCICTMTPVNSATIDPPEPIVNGSCPLHGTRDPDAERDAMRDDREVPGARND